MLNRSRKFRWSQDLKWSTNDVWSKNFDVNWWIWFPIGSVNEITIWFTICPEFPNQQNVLYRCTVTCSNYRNKHTELDPFFSNTVCTTLPHPGCSHATSKYFWSTRTQKLGSMLNWVRAFGIYANRLGVFDNLSFCSIVIVKQYRYSDNYCPNSVFGPGAMEKMIISFLFNVIWPGKTVSLALALSLSLFCYSIQNGKFGVCINKIQVKQLSLLTNLNACKNRHLVHLLV